MNTYASLPVTFDRGEGAYLWQDDQKYFDLLAGIAVCGLGHAHPEIANAIAEQARTLIHTTNLYTIKNQESLADKLCAAAGMSNVFFSNSGAEANEAAIKIARKYGNNQDIKNPTIIVMEHSFHGRTMATLTATGNPKVQSGFEPLLSGFARVPYNDITAIKKLSNNADIVAVLVEPIQGEGGINIPDDNYLSEIRTLCDENNWLMMLDEIQTGMGRTGSLFHFQQHNLTPDVMTLAKGLANGMPIGACLTHGKAKDILEPGNHGSTFGGNPLSTRAALVTLDIIERDNLSQRASEVSDILVSTLHNNLNQELEIRHAGLMIGIDLKQPCAELVKIALDEKLLINVTADSVVRLLPPLTLTNEEAKEAGTRVATLINQFLA